MIIEVVYANESNQKIYYVDCEENSTVKQIINQSFVLVYFPEIDLSKQAVGIYGEIIGLDYIVKAGDRIEIYRPLTINPKDARRVRAEEKRKKDGLKLFGA